MDRRSNGTSGSAVAWGRDTSWDGVINFRTTRSVVGSARDAMRILQRVTPDVIVTDIAMPTNDGYWLIDQVRARSAVDGGKAGHRHHSLR